MRMSEKEVNEQKKRFDYLMESCNLEKAGAIMFRVQKQKLIKCQEFAFRYLEFNKIQPCMIDPETMRGGRDSFYSDILVRESLDAYVNSRIKRNAR